jgi:hypothetical protein
MIFLLNTLHFYRPKKLRGGLAPPPVEIDYDRPAATFEDPSVFSRKVSVIFSCRFAVIFLRLSIGPLPERPHAENERVSQ